MIKNSLKKGGMLLLILVAFTIITVKETHARELIQWNANIEDGYKKVVETYPSASLQLWHHSGGYWSNQVYNIRIDDEDMQYLIDGTITADVLETNPAVITTPIPQAVVDFIDDGGSWEEIDIRFSLDMQGVSIYDVIKNGQAEYEINTTNNTLTVQYYPKFNVIEEQLVFWDSNMNVSIPRIESKFGMNVFSMYNRPGFNVIPSQSMAREHWWGAGSEQGIEVGGLDEGGDIVNSDGHIRSGKTIRVIKDGVTHYAPSEQIRIGNGTFRNGGAVGLEWVYRIKAEWYIDDDKNDMSIHNLNMFRNNTQVSVVDAKQKHNFRFTVRKAEGEKLVNPVLVDVEVRDLQSNTILHRKTYREYQDLSIGNDVYFRTDDIDVPRSVRVCATINSIHHQNDENYDLTNDTACQDYHQILNFAVVLGNVDMPVVSVVEGQNFNPQTLTFRADAIFQSTQEASENVWVVLRDRNNNILGSERINISPSWSNIAPIEVMFADVTVNNLRKGENNFTIEINPIASNGQREYIEYAPSMSNVYSDNVTNITVYVYEYVEGICEDCNESTKNNRNVWTETFYETTWSGEWIEQTCTACDYDDEGNGDCWDYDCSYCLRDYEYDEYDVTITERYYIDKVYFRSKYTRDVSNRYSNIDSQGWTDILANPSQNRTKAGYGFELRVVVKYENNFANARGNTWSRCSDGRQVSPHRSNPHLSENVCAILPIRDSFNQNIKITLNKTRDNTYSTGNSRTSPIVRERHFELPFRNVTGLGAERKVYVPEDVRDSSYDIRIILPEIQSMHWNMPELQDCVTVTFRVDGSMYDDVNTHIVQ